MKPAEFHEKEFEGFLYSQLEASDRQLWHPHEVLENYLGFDRAMFLADSFLWRVHGHRRPLRGFAPFYFYDMWPALRQSGVPKSRLPRFRLNCFIQAKRPEFGSRIPKSVKSLGPQRPVFRINLDAEQQETLERVSARVGDRAIIAYAAPAFHRSAELFAHGARGTVPEHSTFPDVTSLSGHSRWYYNSPGATGIRNPDSEPVVLRSLFERIAESAVLRGEDNQSASEQLSLLANGIREALVTDSNQIAPRVAYLTEEWRQIDAFAESFDAPPAVGSYLRVDAFCRFYQLVWLVAGAA
jgi:hypothetical protein